MARVRSDMGRYATVPVWLAKKVSGNAVKLFTIIAAEYSDFSTNEAEGIPRKELAEHMGKSLDTVDRAKQELIKAGALKIEKRFHLGSRLEDDYFLSYADPNVKPPVDAEILPDEGGRKSAATPEGVAAPIGDGGRKFAAPLRDSDFLPEATSNEVAAAQDSGEVPGEVEGDRLCRILADLMAAEDGPSDRVEKMVRSKRWRDAGRLLITVDGVDPAEAEAMLRWSQRDQKWRTKITTVTGFRALYFDLRKDALADKRNPVRLDSRPATPKVLEALDPSAWHAIRDRFAQDVSADVNQIWISQLDLAGRQGSVLWITGPQRATGWVELRYGRVLARCASKALGTEITSIQFTRPESTPSEQTLEEESVNVA